MHTIVEKYEILKEIEKGESCRVVSFKHSIPNKRFRDGWKKDLWYSGEKYNVYKNTGWGVKIQMISTRHVTSGWLMSDTIVCLRMVLYSVSEKTCDNLYTSSKHTFNNIFNYYFVQRCNIVQLNKITAKNILLHN